ALAHAELAVAIGGDAGGVLTTMLEHGHRIIETLACAPGSDDADEAAHRCFSSSDPHPGPARVPYRLLADELAQPVGDRCPVGDEPRRAPPVFVLELEQLPEDHEHAEQHHAPQQPEAEAEEAIHAAEHRQPHEM